MSKNFPNKWHADLIHSFCLGCDDWLCCTGPGGEFTGIITCPKCRCRNEFKNSISPVRIQEVGISAFIKNAQLRPDHHFTR